MVWVEMTYFHRFFRTIPGVLGEIDYLQESIWSKYALCLCLIIVGRLKLVGLSAQQLIGAGLNGGKYL